MAAQVLHGTSALSLSSPKSRKSYDTNMMKSYEIARDLENLLRTDFQR
jgi:hypothetical protein